MSAATVTPAQAAMLELIDSTFVRRSFERNGAPVWLIEMRRATAAQARVIAALQAKRLVRTESQQIRISGWVGTKAVTRLVRA